jgi:hypothetical protein
MSALPPKADIARRRLDVRFVPKADMSASLDHLVGEQLHLIGSAETEFLGGLGSSHLLCLVFCFLDLLLEGLLLRRIRRDQIDRQLIELAGKPERRLVVAVVYSRAGIHSDEGPTPDSCSAASRG